jgi:TatD DNase family protein
MILADVHAHLTHPRFADDVDAVVARAKDAGVAAIICNGLDPESNRAVLALAERFPVVKPALGLYPLDAANQSIDRAAWAFDFEPPDAFDPAEELAFIATQRDRIIAIGEVGLDGYWLPDTLPEQARVLKQVCALALELDLPIILHSRKAEQETFELVRDAGVRRAVFHCFCGKLKLAREIAAAGYLLSIPPTVERGEGFQRMAVELPLSQLLTETDSPFLSPDKGARNEPALVARSLRAIARLRNLEEVAVAEALEANYERVFGVSPRG